MDYEEINETSSLSIKPPLLKRNYTITNVDDMFNIQNGKCPKYALYWEEDANKAYWSPKHNFYIGKNVEKQNILNLLENKT
jgi:hypothetical protein